MCAPMSNSPIGNLGTRRSSESEHGRVEVALNSLSRLAPVILAGLEEVDVIEIVISHSDGVIAPGALARILQSAEVIRGALIRAWPLTVRPKLSTWAEGRNTNAQ